jgi:glycosyltransferase involved in cell wall biosynthesis
MSSKYASDIKLVGRVSDEELNWLYNGCNLFVLPSLSEGFGLTVLEAASTGVPIACSDIPTLREIMGQGAEYFDPANPENMKDVMVSILHNPTRGEELANLALRRVNHFNWKQAGENTVKLYEDINA